MSNEQLADLTQPQRDRLAFVELRVRFIGEIRRQALVTRFGIQSAAASRDLALYKDLAPGNIDYDAKGKSYVLGPDFRPVFDFPPERVLSWLTQGFGDGEPMRLKAWVASESPSRLTHPDLDVLASVTRAIHQECPLGVEYHSISSGRNEREIVPFALIAQDVLLTNSDPVYMYTKLNDIKPDMITEATQNARQAAQRFAQDSSSKVGTIMSADQGWFNILSAYGSDVEAEQASIEKKVRVITTVNFSLVD